MGRYLLARLASLVFILIAVSLIAFLLMHAVPGGPFDVRERRLPEATQQAQLRKYGLDKPLWEQYLRYMWAAVHLDFGVPFQSPTETVTGLIARAWPITIRIGLLTIVISYTLGLLLGTIAALRQNSWIDYIVTFGATLGLTVPNFVVALWLILLLSVKLGWLPTGGWGEPRNYIMPVIAYSLAPMALVARYTRVSILEVMRADYGPHRPREGALRTAGDPGAHRPQRADPAGDGDGTGDPEHPDRLDLHRAHLPHPWTRLILHHQHLHA